MYMCVYICIYMYVSVYLSVCLYICMPGAYEAGVFKALVELQPPEESRYDVVTGISAGSINAGGICQFPIGKENEAKDFLLSNWLTITKNDVYKNWFPGGVIEGFMLKSGLMDSTPLHNTLVKLVDMRKLRSSGRWLHVGTTNLSKGRVQFFDQKSEDVLLGVMASSAVPGVFPAVKIGEDYFVDGGVEYMDAISDSIRLCYQKYNTSDLDVKVDVVLAISDVAFPKLLEKILTTPFVLMHSIFTMLNNILIADIQNAQIAFPNARIRVFKPSTWLPGWFLGFEHSAEMIQLGFSDTEKILRNSTRF